MGNRGQSWGNRGAIVGNGGAIVGNRGAIVGNRGAIVGESERHLQYKLDVGQPMAPFSVFQGLQLPQTKHCSAKCLKCSF